MKVIKCILVLFVVIVCNFAGTTEANAQRAPSDTILRFYRKNIIKTDLFRSFFYKFHMEYERFLSPMTSVGINGALISTLYYKGNVEMLGHSEEIYVRFYTRKKKQGGPYFQLHGGHLVYRKMHEYVYNDYTVNVWGDEYLNSSTKVKFRKPGSTFFGGFATGVHTMTNNVTFDIQFAFQYTGYPYEADRSVNTYHYQDAFNNVYKTEVVEVIDKRENVFDKLAWYFIQPGAAFVPYLKLGIAF